MPELPEVETIRRGLLDFCVGKKIKRVKVLCDKSFIGPSEAILGAEISEIRRRGKALLVELDNGLTIMIHLRMTGQLIYRGMNTGVFAGGHPSDNFVDELPNKQTRVFLEFADGARLFFNDQRKFGFLKVLPTDEVSLDKFIASLGPEPWEITGDELYEKLQKRKGSPIKAVILDQKIIAGIGNIYADEALYFAGVSPARKAGEVSKEEALKIVEGARDAMERSLESGGSTMATYVKADGTKGDYLELFARVFNRQGLECQRCGAEILKTRVAGRGTHYCPECQK
ncbi:bifunctional DNA-formamidopyrimidine glycosylase/DNA-(apurinic or apyrimidinic site) lyase [Candidatus Saccharibacteria bacterium]|nr:bifunctional DNA-formamidopyrimidine glycosylase/DNA-(apurinic or apyrimidinic site) lyase [Candidatus Saccharibacteria bacterium]